MGVIGLFLALYTLYDVIFKREDMLLLERVIWLVLIFTANILGVLLYLFVVIVQETSLEELLDLDTLQRSMAGRSVDDLERLHRLHEEGALTDEEFEREKRKLLGEESSDETGI